MAPTYRASSGTTFSGSATSVAVPKPTGLAVNDIIDVTLQINATVGTAITKPSGWVEQLQVNNSSATNSQRRFYKVADAADVAAASYTLSWTGTLAHAGTVAAYVGVDTASPVNQSAAQNNGAGSTTGTAPSVTTTVNDTLVVCGIGAQDTTTMSSGAVSNVLSVSRTNAAAGSGDTPQTTAGATGTKAFTLGTSRQNTGTTIAYNPSSSSTMTEWVGMIPI